MLKPITKFASVAILAGMLALTACTEDSNNYEAGTAAASGITQATDLTEEEHEIIMDNLPLLDDTIFANLRDNPVTFLQFAPLTPGEELAVLHTNHGDITLRFFPQEAPQAVENFKTHARNGYYNGVIFHRVIPNFMIQGGCPLGNGTGGESIWGQTFELELSPNLRHFRGALAMAHAGGNMGSQFYIVHNPQPANIPNMTAQGNTPFGRFSDGHIIYYRDVFLPEELEHFAAGGTPHLDWLWINQGIPHPVFGHVVEGMDVVDSIAATATGAGDRPVEDVIIESISFIYAP